MADYIDQAGARHIKTFNAKTEATARKDADAWLARTKVELADGRHQPK